MRAGHAIPEGGNIARCLELVSNLTANKIFRWAPPTAVKKRRALPLHQYLVTVQRVRWIRQPRVIARSFKITMGGAGGLVPPKTCF